MNSFSGGYGSKTPHVCYKNASGIETLRTFPWSYWAVEYHDMNRLVQLLFLFFDFRCIYSIDILYIYIYGYIQYIYIYACVAVVARIHVWDCVWIQIDELYTGLVKCVIVWQKQEPQDNICKIL